MKCVICKVGETSRGSMVLTLQQEHRTVLFKGVPADICDNCGESYVDAATTAKLLSEAHSSEQSGVELEVHRFAAT